MKFSTQEEYGLRCLIQLARLPAGRSMTIPEIGAAENLSGPHVAKLMRILRQGGLVESLRGHAGGYILARPANEITAGETIAVLGGRLFEEDFCDRFTSNEFFCSQNAECAIRSLWGKVQSAVDSVLSETTLADLAGLGRAGSKCGSSQPAPSRGFAPRTARTA